MIVMINTQIILLTPSASEVQNFRNEPDQIFWNHHPSACRTIEKKEKRIGLCVRARPRSTDGLLMDFSHPSAAPPNA